MENEHQMESQELSVEQLSTIAGGIAVGEPYPGQYSTTDIYHDVSEVVAKKLENIKFPGWNYKNSESYTSESSEG
ncbi:hypothetical protein H6G04_13475 [Calothrix membranacea FACHB-236]|nr:hypothetical protein [Calothrix membranacea FACHB-236]